MSNLKTIGDNETVLAELIAKKQNVVPFIGAGFSANWCPTWETFLQNFFNDLKKQSLLKPDEILTYETLEKKTTPNRLELMADYLREHAYLMGFEKELKQQFDKTLSPDQAGKYHLLHHVFPFFKITTNYDSLIEDNRQGKRNVRVAYGCESEKINKYFTERQKYNSLVKLHGDFRDEPSIVLSSSHYTEIYGDTERYNNTTALPQFLQRVFRETSVLFIGCSLQTDRTTAILEDMGSKPDHFAIMKKPPEPIKFISLNQRLQQLGVCPIWVEDYSQIEEVLTLLSDTPVVEKSFTPTPGFFVGRQRELALMETHMTPGSIQAITGAGGVGKTTLALEAAQRFKTKFKDGVIGPIRVDDYSPSAFAVTLANLLRERIQEPRDEQEAQKMVTALLQHRCCLLILDNASQWDDLRYMLPQETCATILVTTRDRDMVQRMRMNCRGFQVAEIPLEIFSESEALALFNEILGPRYLAAEEKEYLLIAAALGFLPLALRQAVTLMVYTPHYQAAELREKLERDGRLLVLQKGHEAGDSDSRAIDTVYDLASPLLTEDLKRVLEYLAICSPGPVPLDFLEQLMAGKERDIREKLEQLYTYSWCERRVLAGEKESYYQLHQLVRELVFPRVAAKPREDFIGLVHTLFTDKAVHFSLKDRYYPQLEEAFEQAVAQKDPRLKKWVYAPLGKYCSYRGYGHFFVRLTQKVEELFADDKWTFGTAYAHRGLILKNWGQLDEALSLYKKQEQICKALGDRAGLSRSYCAQGLIYWKKGLLEKALSLYKKEEHICEELGDRAGLSRSYNNQGLIYKDKGQLEKALSLHKKEEHICEELGDRAGLSRSSCNQGNIYADKGQLEKALSLYKKLEQICEELGDRAGLTLSYGNQGNVYYAKGQLDEAMSLYKKEEHICEELGDRAGLARSWWNQGLLHKKQGDPHTQAQLWQKAIATNKDIGIPTEEDEKALKVLLEKEEKINC